MQVELTQRTGEAVGVFEIDHARGRLPPQSVTERLVASRRADEDSFGMDAREFSDHLPRCGVDHPQPRGTRLKAADLETPARFLPMQPQETEGIAVVSAQQGFYLAAMEFERRAFAGSASS